MTLAISQNNIFLSQIGFYDFEGTAVMHHCGISDIKTDPPTTLLSNAASSFLPPTASPTMEPTASPSIAPSSSLATSPSTTLTVSPSGSPTATPSMTPTSGTTTPQLLCLLKRHLRLQLLLQLEFHRYRHPPTRLHLQLLKTVSTVVTLVVFCFLFCFLIRYGNLSSTQLNPGTFMPSLPSLARS